MKTESTKAKKPVADKSSPIHTMDDKRVVKVRVDILRQHGLDENIPEDTRDFTRLDVTVAELRRVGFAKPLPK